MVEKLTKSKPAFDSAKFNVLTSEILTSGNFYSADSTKFRLNELKYKTEATGSWIVPFIMPFQEVVVLNWGSKLESLTSSFNLHYQANEYSFAGSYSTVGERVTDQVKIRVAHGFNSLKVKLQYNTVSYEDCEWILFVKSCSTKQKQVVRALSFDEMNTLKNGMLSYANQGAIDKVKA